MKSPLLSVILAAVLFTCLVVPAQATMASVRMPAADNLLLNGSFEDGSFGPTYWGTSSWDSGVSFVWEQTQAHEGSRSIGILLTLLNDARWTQTVTVQPNTDYRLSGWIKTENVAHTAGSVDVGAHLSVYGTPDRTPGLFGTNAWTNVSMIFNSGPNWEITIAARLGHWEGPITGTAWFDELKLELANSPPSIHTVFLPLVVKPCPSVAMPSSGNWLDYLNYYRATACLSPVTENPVLSDGDHKHAIYIVKNNVLQHDEDPNNPWYTPEGQRAAQESNLAGNNNANTPDGWAIDTWMQAPFHSVGVLDPRLAQVGYGSYREADGGLQMGAALNVVAGLDYRKNATYPVIWPGNGTTIPIRFHWGEYPSPLTSCPGYSAPSGLPLVIQIGPGYLTPAVSATSFTQNDQPLEHCVFDETTYSNPDGILQGLGRDILNGRDAIVLIPRSPLSAGATYAASITANGKTYTWSFSISGAAQAQEDRSSSGFVR